MAVLPGQPALRSLYGFRITGLSQEEAQLVTSQAEARLVCPKDDRWAGLQNLSGDSSPMPVNPKTTLSATLGWQHNSPAPKALKALVRNGIPASLRPLLWPHFSGANARRLAAPAAYYTNLLVAVSTKQLLQVDGDLHRQFPTHPLLTSTKAAGALQRVLTAFCRHNRSLGYTAALLAVAALLLVVQGVDQEETVFWLLAALFEDGLCAACFAQDTQSCQIEQRTLEELVAKKCPRLVAHLARAECPLESLTSGWFPGLFVRALPAETTARVFDCLFVEGPKVLYRVALALFKMNEPALLHIEHGARIARVLQWRAARTYNSDALMRMAFRGIGSFSSELLNRTRRAQEAVLRAELVSQKQRLDALLHAKPAVARATLLAPVSESDDESQEG